MKTTRRSLLAGLAGSAALAAGPTWSFASSPKRLVAAPARVQLAPEGYGLTDVWAYDGGLPGPTIRMAQGTTLRREFENRLDQPSTVHWHGIRIDNAMDGVAGLTQDAVAPGERFAYEVALRDAGTYWYHPHNRSWEQMARGLYGALIVEEADASPDVDADEVLLLDDWRLADDAQIAGGFGALHDWAHGGRLGNWITVNGDGAYTRPVQRHDRLRLRLVNTANARIFSLAAQGLDGWVVALDGMPLETPQKLDQLFLAPAQRADLIVDIVAEEGEEAFLISFERDGGFAVAAFPVEGVTRAERMPQATALPPNAVPPLGALDDARHVRLTMEGGAMGRLQSAMLDGREMDMRGLAAEGKVWAFNGTAGMPETPLIEADRGETVRIEIFNDTSWPHGMHLHGHHFRRVQGREVGPLRDTLLMDAGETAEIAFVADNPGDWLLHCHMLEHSAAGMMTWLRVA